MHHPGLAPQDDPHLFQGEVDPSCTQVRPHLIRPARCRGPLAQIVRDEADSAALGEEAQPTKTLRTSRGAGL